MMKTERREKHLFQFSGFGHEKKTELTEKVQCLGGRVVEGEFSKEITHLISKKPCRSEKFLGAIITGKWVLTPAFLDESYYKGKWLKEDSYEWDSSKSHLLQPGSGQDTYLSAPRYWRIAVRHTGRGPFVGWRISLLVENQQKKAVYKRLLALGGAEIVRLVLPIKDHKNVATSLSHLFVDTTWRSAVRSLESEGVLCCDPVFIGNYLMRVGSEKEMAIEVGGSPVFHRRGSASPGNRPMAAGILLENPSQSISSATTSSCQYPKTYSDPPKVTPPSTPTSSQVFSSPLDKFQRTPLKYALLKSSAFCKASPDPFLKKSQISSLRNSQESKVKNSQTTPSKVSQTSPFNTPVKTPSKSLHNSLRSSSTAGSAKRTPQTKSKKKLLPGQTAMTSYFTKNFKVSLFPVTKSQDSVNKSSSSVCIDLCTEDSSDSSTPENTSKPTEKLQRQSCQSIDLRTEDSSLALCSNSSSLTPENNSRPTEKLQRQFCQSVNRGKVKQSESTHISNELSMMITNNEHKDQDVSSLAITQTCLSSGSDNRIPTNSTNTPEPRKVKKCDLLVQKNNHKKRVCSQKQLCESNKNNTCSTQAHSNPPVATCDDYSRRRTRSGRNQNNKRTYSPSPENTACNIANITSVSTVNNQEVNKLEGSLHSSTKEFGEKKKMGLAEAVIAAKKLKKSDLYMPVHPSFAFFQSTNKKARNPTCMSDAALYIVESCINEDFLLTAVDAVLSAVNRKFYPQPKLLHILMEKMILQCECVVQASCAYNALCQILSLHPPTSVVLQSTYIQSLRLNGRHEGNTGEEWAFVFDIISNAISLQKENDEETSNAEVDFTPQNMLMLRYLVALFEADFKAYLTRPGGVSSCGVPVGRPCILAQILWPQSRPGKLNSSCTDLMSAIILAIKRKKSNVLKCLQSLLAMTASCCQLGSASSDQHAVSMTTLTHYSIVFAKELTYRIANCAEEDLRIFLGTVELPWLGAKVCQTLLDISYDDSLLPPQATETMNMETIVSRYFYLLPPRDVNIENISPSPAEKILIEENYSVISHRTKPERSGRSFGSALSPNISTRNINKRNHKGETPLMLACMRNNVPRVQDIIQTEGVDVNLSDYAGWTPLHEACHRGHMECVRLLLNYRPMKNITSYFKSNVDKCVDIFAVNLDKVTCLHDAVIQNHPEIARLLVKYGGKKLLEIKSQWGFTPLDLAATEEMREILKSDSHREPPAKRQKIDSQASSMSFSQSSSQGDSSQEGRWTPSDGDYNRVLSSGGEHFRFPCNDMKQYLFLCQLLLKFYLKTQNMALVVAYMSQADHDVDGSVLSPDVSEKDNPGDVCLLQQDMDILQNWRCHVKHLSKHVEKVTERKTVEQCHAHLQLLTLYGSMWSHSS